MSVGEARIASIAFVVMTASVALNVFVLQPDRNAARLAANGLPERALTPFGQMPGGLVDREQLGSERPSDIAVLKVAPPAVGSITPVTNSAELTRGVQRELNARGYDAGPPDGVVGMVTRAAIMAYEYDYGLALTATPSDDLLGRIILGTSSRPASQANTVARSVGPEAQNMIATVAGQLQALGYPVGNLNGRPTEQFARAIRTFEIDQKLKETGRISGPLVSRLAKLQVLVPAKGGRSAAVRR